MESSSKLDQTIIEVLECVQNPPPNESTTCEWVIYPLLLTIGYSRRDIISRVADNNGQFPDYAILPDSDHTWYLEAKSWSQPLSDSHAQQSLNYANQNGRRWVVLSNGQDWRLYDNRIEGLAAQKLVACAGLAEISKLTRMLMALGKQAVASSDLERFARTTRLAAVLSEQFANPDSEIARAIWSIARRLPGLSAVTRAEIISCPSLFTVHANIPEGSPSKRAVVLGKRKTPRAADTSSQTYTLQALKEAGSHAVSGRKPTTLSCPGGMSLEVRTWTAVGIGIVTWRAEGGRLPPLPYSAHARGKSYLLDTSSQRGNVKMLRFEGLPYNGGTLCVNTNRSAWDWITCMSGLCEAVGTDLTEFSIGLELSK